MQHVHTGEKFVIANMHTTAGRKLHAITGNLRQRLLLKHQCMVSVLNQTMAFAASQGRCNAVAAGDWNMTEETVSKVMQERPAGERWWSIGTDKDFILSTCESWQVEVDVTAHDNAHTAWVAQLQPSEQPAPPTPTRDNLSEKVLRAARQMVARFRARAVRRAEEARLAAEAMEEKLAQQSEKSGTRQEEEALALAGQVQAEHESVESDTEAQQNAKPPSEDDDEKNPDEDWCQACCYVLEYACVNWIVRYWNRAMVLLKLLRTFRRSHFVLMF